MEAAGRNRSRSKNRATSPMRRVKRRIASSRSIRRAAAAGRRPSSWAASAAAPPNRMRRRANGVKRPTRRSTSKYKRTSKSTGQHIGFFCSVFVLIILQVYHALNFDLLFHIPFGVLVLLFAVCRFANLPYWYPRPLPIIWSWLYYSGAGESGKSTIVKQMRILHVDGFSEE